MQIEEQIKALQRIKAKMDLYRKVQDNIQAEKNSKESEHLSLNTEHPGLVEEFCDEVIAFCVKRIEMLGNPGVKPAPPIKETLIEADIPKQAAKSDPVPSSEPADPLKFLLKYRHLDGKRVEVDTPNGKVLGTVRGLVTPYITVETDTGYNIQVEPTKLKVS